MTLNKQFNSSLDNSGDLDSKNEMLNSSGPMLGTYDGYPSHACICMRNSLLAVRIGLHLYDV